MLSFNKKEFSFSEWKRINMRNITNLLGVEFIHDLYNRHLPKINSIRFRNTIIIWKNGVANSYAPKKEWALLEKWLGEKFIKLDDTLIKQIEALLNFDRSFINNFINSLEKTNFNTLKNKELGLHLINLQGYTLGELYQVNLIQIEHSLTFAIKKILKDKWHDPRNSDTIFHIKRLGINI